VRIARANPNSAQTELTAPSGEPLSTTIVSCSAVWAASERSAAWVRTESRLGRITVAVARPAGIGRSVSHPGLKCSCSVAAGPERPAFEDAYDEHVWDVYGFLGYRLSSRDEAEDLTQITFERALRAWRRFDPGRASARTWLLAIARNVLIDHYRSDRSNRQQPIPDEPHTELPDLGAVPPDEPVLGPEPELARALDRLGDRERELIALRFGGDMTGAEIAELTGLTLANVQQILSRSLRRLRADLETEVEREASR
jgi:RNA polymerase sigma factor (sigma-70 family)